MQRRYTFGNISIPELNGIINVVAGGPAATIVGSCYFFNLTPIVPCVARKGKKRKGKERKKVVDDERPHSR